MYKRSILLILLCTVLLNACGQTGALYLPTPENEKKRPRDTFILKGAQKPSSRSDTKNS